MQSLLFFLVLLLLLGLNRGDRNVVGAPPAPAPADLCAESGCSCSTDEIGGRLSAICHVTKPEFPTKLPNQLAILHVFCDTMKDINGRPVVDMKLLTRIPDNALKGLPNLMEVYITGCPVSEFPPMLFANLTNLRQVTLESLLLVRLGGTLFWNSTNLEKLQIINMADLVTIDPVLLHAQHHLSTVTLKRMNISGNEVAKLIKPLQSTLGYFTWSMSFSPVTLPQTIFRGFSRLKELDLRNNQLQNMDFLVHTRTLALILEKNPKLATSPPFDFSRCRQLRDLIKLDLRATNMRHVGRELAVFRHLRHLYLGNNHLTVVPKVIYTHLNDTLERLDLSNNKIQVFPEALNKLFWNPRFEADIENNPVHCNCEVKWLFKFPHYMRDMRCASTPQTMPQLKDRLLVSLKAKDFKCEPPTIPTIIVKNAVQTRSNFYGIRASALASSPDQTVIEYDGRRPIPIGRGQTLILRCDSSGDPAPQLFWHFPAGFTLKRQPDPDRTLHKNLIETQIQHSHLKRFREAKFVCKAKNPAGSRQAFVVLKNLHPSEPIDKDLGSTETISKSVTAQPSRKDPGGPASTSVPTQAALLLSLLFAYVVV